MRISSLLALLGTYLAVLLAFLARLVRLEDRPIWWDEGWSVWLARQDFLSIAQRTAADEHPPLHYWLLHIWTTFAGEDPFAVRFTSVLTGVLAVALLYRLGADLVGPRAGLVAAFLLAGSRFHLWWSQEIKMYSLAIFLALLSSLLFVRLLRRGQRRIQVLYLLATLACLLTSYLGVLVPAVQSGVLLVAAAFRRGDRAGWQVSWRRWLMLQAGLGVAFSPWAAYYLAHAQRYQRIGAFEPFQALRLYFTVLPLGISVDIERYTPVALAFAGLALVGAAGAMMRWVRPGPGRGRLPAESWLLPVISVLIIPLALLAFTLPEYAPYQPKVSERYMILFLPMYLLLLAYGLVWLWGVRRSLAVLVAVGCSTTWALTLTQYYGERRLEHSVPALAYALSTLYRPDDVIVLNPDNEWPLWAYHIPIADGSWLRLPYGARMTPGEAAHWLGPLSTRAQTVWLITDAKSAITDPRREVPRWLADHFPQAGSRSFLRSRLTLYSRDPNRSLERVAAGPGAPASPVAALPYITLTEVGPLPRRLQAGQTAYLFTTWLATAPTTRNYRAWLSLYQEQDQHPVPRQEYRVGLRGGLLEGESAKPWLPGETLLARHQLSVPVASEGGRYTVVLEVEGAGGRERVDVPLGTVEVEPVGDYAATAADLTPSLAVLGSSVELAGHRLSAQVVRPGDRLTVDLRWLARGEVPQDYSAFVHLSSADDVVWASGDSLPGNGSLPTSAWTAGDTIDDTHTVSVPAITPPGTYTIFVGMYDPFSGQRLAAATPDGQLLPDNRIILGTVRVEP